MSVKAALVHHLTNATDAPTVQPLIALRLYPAGRVPQDIEASDGAYMVYQRISSERPRHQDGAAGVYRARIQFDCYAATAGNAQALRQALITDLDDYRGEMGAAGSTVTVKRASCEDVRDDPVPATEGSQRAPWRESVDFLIWHTG